MEALERTLPRTKTPQRGIPRRTSLNLSAVARNRRSRSEVSGSSSLLLQETFRPAELARTPQLSATPRKETQGTAHNCGRSRATSRRHGPSPPRAKKGKRQQEGPGHRAPAL